MIYIQFYSFLNNNYLLCEIKKEKIFFFDMTNKKNDL